MPLLPFPGTPGGTNAIGSVSEVQNYLTDKALNQEKQRLENKFAPLDRGIKLQNALSYGNRMGNIGLFLRGISQMPAAERQAYLADPANRQNYLTMLEQFRGGINNPQASGNVLTPEFLQQFGLGAQQQTPSNPIAKLISYFTGAQQNAMHPEALPANGMPFQQSAMPLALNQGQEFGESNQATPEEVEKIANQGNRSAEQSNKPAIEEASQQETTPQLTQNQRSTLNAQMRANNQNISSEMKTRADATIAFEKFLQLHRNEIGKVFNDAFKYSQIYGRAKNWLDKFKRNQPKEYANFIKAKNSLVPLMSNGLRRLEAMGISHEAQEDAKNQIAAAINSIDISPQTAREVFNSHMKALAD